MVRKVPAKISTSQVKIVWPKKSSSGRPAGRARVGEKGDDEREVVALDEQEEGQDDVGERREEVGPQLAAEDGQRAVHAASPASSRSARRRARVSRVVRRTKMSSSEARAERELDQRPAALDREAEDRRARVGARRCSSSMKRPAAVGVGVDRAHARDLRQRLGHAVGGARRTRPSRATCALPTLAQLVGAALGDDPAAVDDQHAPAEQLDLGQDVGREQQRVLLARARGSARGWRRSASGRGRPSARRAPAPWDRGGSRRRDRRAGGSPSRACR